jgi:hypothetical protein
VEVVEGSPRAAREVDESAGGSAAEGRRQSQEAAVEAARSEQHCASWRRRRTGLRRAMQLHGSQSLKSERGGV